MRVYIRPQIVLSGVAAKCRKFWLIAAATLAPSFLVVSEPALAQACGPLVNGSVTCTSGPNPYPGGISYTTPNPPPNTNLSVTLQSDVNVVFQNPGTAVLVHNIAGGSAVLTANGATIDNTASPNSTDQIGLSAIAENGAGDAIVAATGKIDVRAIAGGNGIVAAVNGSGALASVIYDGPGVSSSGGVSTAIQATNRAANGNAVIDAAGNMSGFVPAGFQQFSGLFANAEGNGDASVRYRRGTIDVQGNFANGIFAFAGGSATIITDPGTTIIVSGTNPGDSSPTQPVKPGIDAESGAGTAAGGQTVTVTAASTIMAFGTVAPDSNKFNNPVAIRALSFLDAPISVTYTGPGMTTVGGGGIGILALSGSGNINVNSSGPITANGIGAFGILADSGMVLNMAIGALPGVGGPIAVMATAPISTQGVEAPGIWANSTTGAVRVDATNVSALGQFSMGIKATGGGPVVVNIPTGGSVMGGWQVDVTGVGPTLGLPAAGIVLGSTGSTAILTNNGSIGALSDRAVFGDPSIINNGTMTGFVQLTGINDYTNNGTFNFRHFADTNGDGVRDTLRVAVSDLGSGPSTFTNNGRLALLGGPGATTLDGTGQYLPFGLAVNSMALGGPVQGQILGATTFTNSGVIDLQANPVAGDVLVISGGHAPGTSGGGTFISNGGSLLIDTVLNQGGAASHSDILVVDGTQVGAAGATLMSVHNAGGAGAETVGNGIPVVQVLDPSRSAGGAFALVGEVRGGAFDYRLFQSGLNGSDPGDWFLRSSFVNGPGGPEEPIGPSPPPPVLPPGVFPIIGPELATYGVVQPIARQMGLTTLGTLHERVGDAAADAACLSAAAIGSSATFDGAAITKAPPVPDGGCRPTVWGRLFGQQIDNHYQAFADPRASGQVAGIQTGVDVWRGSFIPGHSDTAGLYFAYGNGKVGVDGLVTNPAATAYILQHTGSVNLNAYSLGGYWTHYGPTGWYIDAVLQGSFYNGNATTPFANLPTNGTGFTSSLEAGYPILLPWFGPRFVLEPEGQIIWQHVSFQDANDGLGPVGLGTTSGASGRLGLRGKWTISDPAGRVWQPYLLANVWRDWGANATTMFGPDPVPLLERATRLEFAAGFSAKLLPGLSLYAQAGYQFATSSEQRRDGVKGDFGVRYSW
jgi:outer membrane autotransporter protein